jgi:hypothetical protein
MATSNKTWYVAIGRAAGVNEDSVYVFRAYDYEEAIQTLRANLKCKPEDVIASYIIRCTRTDAPLLEHQDLP